MKSYIRTFRKGERHGKPTKQNGSYHWCGQRNRPRRRYRFSKEGVNIGLIGRTEANVEKVAEEVKALGVKASFAAADVKNQKEVEQAVSSIKEELGEVDILINNAGISKFGGFLDLTPEEWEDIIQVNVMGVYHVTRAVLPEMIERKSGDIINISSTAGQRGAAATSAYSASICRSRSDRISHAGSQKTQYPCQRNDSEHGCKRHVY